MDGNCIQNMNAPIYRSDYVCKISALDHCHELISLQDALVKAKANKKRRKKDIENINFTFEQEMIDLFIIIGNWCRNNPDREDLVFKRIKRFEEKSKEDEGIFDTDCEEGKSDKIVVPILHGKPEFNMVESNIENIEIVKKNYLKENLISLISAGIINLKTKEDYDTIFKMFNGEDE